MEKAHDSERKDIRSIWTQMIQKMGNHDIHDFLRTMWVSRHGDLKKDDLFTALKNHIETKNISAIDFARECGDECDDYFYLAIADESQLPKDSFQYVRAITRELGLRPALPLLLSSYLSLNEADFADVARFILVFVVRYSIIGNRDSSGMEDLLFRLAREVRTMAVPARDKTVSLQAKGHVKATLASHAPDDNATKMSVLDADPDPSDAKYVMTRLARYIQDPEKQVTLGETNLEHIYPQNPEANAWGGPANQEKLEPLTWNLGNLTIFGKRANRKAANDEFDKKRIRYAQSKILMTQQLPNDDTVWDEAAIKTRAKVLAKLVIHVWNFNNPSQV